MNMTPKYPIFAKVFATLTSIELSMTAYEPCQIKVVKQKEKNKKLTIVNLLLRTYIPIEIKQIALIKSGIENGFIFYFPTNSALLEILFVGTL